MKSTVSVIIPFFKHIDWLDEALDSVVRQSYPIMEILLIDDGSKEEVSILLEKYREYNLIYYKQNNCGPAAARNKGIELSKGEYIVFLDSDDIWLPIKLEKQINYMKKNDAIWSHTSYETFIDGRDKEVSLRKKVSHFSGNVFPEILASCPIATPSVIVKGNILRENKKFRFNESMRFGQDTFLWIYLAMEYNLYAIDECLTRVRLRGTNAALQVDIQLNFRSIVWEELINKNEFPKERVPLVTRLAYRLANLGSKFNKIAVINYINNKTNNAVIKAVYLIPWLLFKKNRKR